jgi:guanylate kinase
MSSEPRDRVVAWIISGPSGSGKTTLVEALLKDPCWRARLLKSVSLTTRALRPGEVQGRDYVSVDEPAFRSLARQGALLEYERIFGFYYGTPRRILDEARRGRQDALFCIDVKGAASIRRRLKKNVFSIFIMPPSMRALLGRLTGRGTETKKEIEKRLRRVKIEISCAKKYDYVVVNDRLDAALEKIKAILTAKRCEASYVRTTGKTER